jgi:putative cell wall teichoic acid glycosylation protein gtcA
MKKIKELYLKYKELINYLIFGVLTTVVSLGTYYILVLTILDANNPIELQIANIIAWITCVTFAYITNKKYVFAPTNKSIIKEMIEFYSSRLLSLFIDMGLMFLLVSTLHFNDKIVKIIIQIIIIILNYILSKLIIFKKENKS